MARNRKPKNAHLPPNLYCRKGYYSYRNPETGIEYGIGRNKAEAVNDAIAANYQILSSKVKPNLVERISGNEILLHEWILEYVKTLEDRNLKKSTFKGYISKLNIIKEHIPNIDISLITSQLISQLIDKVYNSGKKSMAMHVRLTAIDLFKEAIMKGNLKENPASPTRAPRTQVKRSRLSFDDFIKIKNEIKAYGRQYELIMELGLLTGQRIGDLIKLQKSNITNDRLLIIQAKTGTKLSIPLTLFMGKIEKSVGDVVTELISISFSDNLFTNSNGNPLQYESVFRQFSTARKNTGLSWGDKTPPSFHEIRSLAARLYKKEKNGEFAQSLLGHKSIAMTEKYQDSRSDDWNIISE